MARRNKDILIQKALILFTIVLCTGCIVFFAGKFYEKKNSGTGRGVTYLDQSEKEKYLQRIKNNNPLKSSLLFNKESGFGLYDRIQQDSDSHIALSEQGTISSVYNLKGIDLSNDYPIELPEEVTSVDQALNISGEFYRDNYALFGLQERDVTDSLSFRSTQNEGAFYYSIAPQYFNNSIPVQGAFADTILTGVDSNTTKLLSASANLYSIPAGFDTVPAITAGEAIESAIQSFQWNTNTTDHTGPQLVILPYHNSISNQLVYVLTWHFNISSSTYFESYEVWIDARNQNELAPGQSCIGINGEKSRLCQKRSLLAEGKVEGTVDTQLAQRFGFPDLNIPGGGRTDAQGNFSDNGSVSNVVMSGQHVNVFQRNIGGAQSRYSGPPSVNLDSSISLDERTVYYGVSRVRDYWEKERGLNFGDATSPVPAIVRSDEVNQGSQHGCNAFYQFDRNIMQFGSTCASAPFAGKNLGEYLAIAAHEYGHAITAYVPNYNWVPGRNLNFEIGANEGWGDYVACTVTGNSIIPLVQRDCQNNFTTANIASLCPRSPDGSGAEVHCAGQVFSGSLWDARQKLGQETFDRIVAKAQNIGGVLDSYESFLRLLLIADDTDNNSANGSPHCGSITAAFRQHGIVLPNVNCTDSAGGNTNMNSVNQNQNAAPKSISISAAPTNGTVPLSVSFSITLKSFNKCPANFSVNFGDGKSTAPGGNCDSGNPILATQSFQLTHMYEQNGNFQARVTADTLESENISIGATPIADPNQNNNQSRNENQNSNNNNTNGAGSCDVRGDINCDTRVDQTDLSIIYNFVVNKNIPAAAQKINNGDTSECSIANRKQENINDTDVAYYRELITNGQWPLSCN